MPSPAVSTDKIMTPARPFLKWAGSKRQLLNRFIDLYPPALKAGRIENYYEPFLGSGAVFFDIAQRYKITTASLSDVNDDLVLTYQVIQSYPEKIVAVLLDHQKKYQPLSKTKRTSYFYEQRELFNSEQFDLSFKINNSKGIQRAARLIFLNHTCFNGLYRVNARGVFNTPAGDYANPTICDEKNLARVSALLAMATISKTDFSRIEKKVKPASFVYFDPPYRPLSSTANFTAYSKSAFTDIQQAALAAICKALDKKKVVFMLSNSDTADGFFEGLYGNFNIKRVPAKRLINADASKRGVVNELLVTNYKV